MKKKLFPGIAVLCAWSCTADQAPPPEAPCNITETILYSTHIKRIFYNHCITCHNNNDRLGSISLEGYDHAKQVIAAGRLLGAIRHTPGFSPMPQGNGPKLDNCGIQTIQKWMDSGMPE